MRTEQEVRGMLDVVYNEMTILNENPPVEPGEYTELMDELEHMEKALRWVLGETAIKVFT